MSANIIQYIVYIAIILILLCLGSALFYLISNKTTDRTRVVKALSLRIGLSIGLFIFLFVAFAMGWVSPHSLM